MTSEEMTTGSVSGTEAERKWFAARSRWWNSTGGGSWKENGTKQKGNIKAGDGGVKFRTEWEDLDKENWKYIKENKVDPATGVATPDPASSTTCAPGMALRRPSGSQAIAGAVVEGGRAAVGEGSWFKRNKLLVVGGLIFTYVLIARLLGDGSSTAS